IHPPRADVRGGTIQAGGPCPCLSIHAPFLHWRTARRRIRLEGDNLGMSYSTATTMSDEDLAPSPIRRTLAWSGLVLLLIACAAAVALAVSPPRPAPRLAFPRIHGAGGVLPVGPNALMPSTTADHR